MAHFKPTTQAAGIALTTGAILVLQSTMASAHHAMGGKMPDTFTSGLVSGLAHPVIGFDHLAFIVAAGIASAFFAERLLLPLILIVATVVGCLMSSVSGVSLPAGEYVIAASVLAIGIMVMSGQTIDKRVYGALFAVAGLFHGNAYAASIVGSESTPLLAYLIGFAAIQLAIMVCAAFATDALSSTASRISTEPRLAGAVVAGVGATFVIEHAEKLIFPGL